MRFVLLTLFLYSSSVNAQSYFMEHFGGAVGLILNFGSHSNSFGLNLKGYYKDHFYQVNANSTFYFHSKNFGGRTNFIENRTALGAVLLAGKKEMSQDFMLDGLNHQSTFNYGVGYNYIWYRDNRGTSQNSGGFGVHLKKLSLYQENDVFGGQGRDRFRSGRVNVSYRTDNVRYSLGLSIWTGETRGAPWQKLSWDDCPNGFKLLESLPYGKTSHGILYAGVSYNLPYAQVATMRVGIDSEQVRHGFQNRLIHDLMFLPKKMKRSTPHYPRLDSTGCPIFSKSARRKDLLYLQFGANGNWSD
ncbi:MAG: polymorphic toxin type 23 domain-containing protein [Crocinitomicaceae bacterium]|nr:polymorphic toxin type 23 domain-containing protein [Crocinitomicaceae bacterium]MDG1657774.1 polymorphic toxin type 23 domain-containing protein [Crocinitomicaceae bacterium]